MDWFITVKFALLIEPDLPKRVTSADLKPKVKLRRSGRHLENRYNIISCWGWIFGRNSADWKSDMPSTVIWSKSKPEVELEYGGLLLFQTGNSYISDVDWSISTIFALLVDIDLLKRGTSVNPNPEVKLRLSVRHLENRYHNSADDGIIWMKFHSLMQNDLPNTVIWRNHKRK